MPARSEEDAFLADIIKNTTPIAYDWPKSVPKIHSMEELESNLPAICEVIHKTLGSQNLEATYQRCLAMDLKEAGVLVICEVDIPILYRGKKVATRRADIIVKTLDGKVAVLELKALATPMAEKTMQQLTYYMHYFGVGIKHGFLVNFPHDTGFPDVDPKSQISMDYSLEYTALCGGPLKRDATRSKGVKNANAEVQICKVKLVPVAAAMSQANSRANTPIKPDRQPPSASAAAAPVAPAVAHSGQSPSASADDEAGWAAVAEGKAKVTHKGTPCKVCVKEGELCKRWHAPKAT